jgi:hypothetical protein
MFIVSSAAACETVFTILNVPELQYPLGITITTVILLFVDVVTKSTVDGVIDCMDAAFPVVVDTCPVFLFIDTTPVQVELKNLAGCVAVLIPVVSVSVWPELPYPLGTVIVICGARGVATSTAGYDVGLNVIGVAALPVVADITPSQLTDNTPVHIAYVNTFAGCDTVTSTAASGAVLKYPDGGVTVTATTLLVLFKTIGNDAGVNVTADAFPNVDETIPS